MSYIGNQVTSVPFSTDVFSGTAAQTLFGPLLRSPATAASIMVFVAGVYQRPTLDYSLSSGNFVSFVSAPASGTNNIVVHHIGNSVMATQVPVDGSVTTTSIVDGAVRGNQIGVTAVTSNHIVLGAVTTNLIADGAVSGNQLGLYSISGNNIGTGAISANNFAGGGITSNVLSSNLTISTSRVAETINVVTSATPGLAAGQSANYNVHVSNSTVYNFTANSTGNITFNIVANAAMPGGLTGTANDLIRIGQSVSVALMLKHGTVRYRANLFVDGVLQTAFWAGNTQPQYQTTGGTGVIDVYNFSIVKIGDSRYNVFASNTQFGQANGQGMGVTVAPFGQGQ
jgi:hypothetical protein